MLKPSSKLMNRNFLLLLQGQVISQIGTQISRIAMLFWLKHATESPTLLGTIAMLSGLVAVLLGVLGGAFADRYSRRWIIIICDLIDGCALISLSILMLFAPTANSWILAGIFFVSILVSAVGSFFDPAFSASTADLVPKEKVSAANSMLQTFNQLSNRLGQGIGGVLFQLLGAPLVLLIDGLTYLFAAFSGYFIKIPQELPEKKSHWREDLREFMREIGEGFGYIRSTAGMIQLLLVSTFLNFFIVPILGLYPFYIEDHLKLDPSWYGYLLATFGVGALAGYILAGAITVSGLVRPKLFIACMLLVSVLSGMLGVTKTPLAVALVTAGIGAASGFLNINLMTILQLTTPSEIRGRVFGLLGTLSGCLMPLGMGVSGVVATLSGKNIPLIYLCCGAAMTLISLITLSLSGVRNYLSFEPDDKREDDKQEQVPLDYGSEKTAAAD